MGCLASEMLGVGEIKTDVETYETVKGHDKNGNIHKKLRRVDNKCEFCRKSMPHLHRVFSLLKSMTEIYEINTHTNTKKLSVAANLCISCIAQNEHELEKLENEIDLRYNKDIGRHLTTTELIHLQSNTDKSPLNSSKTNMENE